MSGSPALLSRDQQATLWAVLDAQVSLLWPDGGGDDSHAVTSDVLAFLEETSTDVRGLIAILLDLIRDKAGANGVPIEEWAPERRRQWLRDFPRMPLFGIIQAQLRDAVAMLLSLGWLIIYSRPPGRDLVGPAATDPVEPVAHPMPPRPNLTDHYAVCVVGSGAAGAVVAASLAKSGIGPILMLEAGAWVEPKDFPIRDDQALAKLYASAGVVPALSSSFPLIEFLEHGRLATINVLQGRVVGGGPVVNNAICLPMPDPETSPDGPWSRWQAAGAPFSYAELATAWTMIREDLELDRTNVDNLCGWRSAIFGELPEWSRLTVAVSPNCVGCGGCNTGCRYGLKSGGLQGTEPNGPRSYLERAIAGGVTIADRVTVDSFLIEDGQVVGAAARDFSGDAPQEIKISADAFVLSAGPLASSVILGNTDLPAELPVGERISANVVTPVYGVFPDVDFAALKHEFPALEDPGLQMCYYVGEEGKLLNETWFHFPGSIAASLPAWFEDHATVMKAYDTMACVGVVVPTGPHGFIDANGKLALALNDDEFNRMLSGIGDAARRLFRAGAATVFLGAKEPTTFTPDQQPELDNSIRALIRESADLNLATPHPQGGSAISADPTVGVVDSNFQVRGATGLFVADASLFPDGCGVNPMMTTMALAHLAADKVITFLSGGQRLS